MQTKKDNWKLKLNVFFIFLIPIIISCDKSEVDDGEMTTDYIIKTDSSIDNRVGLNHFQSDVNLMVKSLDFDTTAYTKNLVNGLKSMDLTEGLVEKKRFEKVSLKVAVGEIFNASTNPCSLPEKVKKKLGNKRFAPIPVNEQLKRYPDSVYHTTGESLSAVLNTIEIISNAGKKRTFPILNSPSYLNFNANEYLISGAYDNFFYSLDCSGYMNTAIEASATGTIVGGVSASAKLALQSQNTMFVAGGTIASPIYAAYHNNVLGTKLDTASMVAILQSILSIPNIRDSDTVHLPSAYVVIWASKMGKGSFNGVGEFKGRAGVGLGLASFSSANNSGGQVSRESNFSNYDTYIVDTERLSESDAILVSEIKARIAELKK